MWVMLSGLEPSLWALTTTLTYGGVGGKKGCLGVCGNGHPLHLGCASPPPGGGVCRCCAAFGAPPHACHAPAMRGGGCASRTWRHASARLSGHAGKRNAPARSASLVAPTTHQLASRELLHGVVWEVERCAQRPIGPDTCTCAKPGPYCAVHPLCHACSAPVTAPSKTARQSAAGYLRQWPPGHRLASPQPWPACCPPFAAVRRKSEALPNQPGSWGPKARAANRH